jgi:indolepyruvate ferredoxin oxidoreductase alpha subunit
MAGRDEKKVSCIIGDSTFMHSGITGLIDAVYNNARFTTIILDNSITAMTGHQVNPGTGQTLQGQAAPKVDLFNLIKSCGVPEEHISVVEAYELKNLRDTLKKHWKSTGRRNYSQEQVRKF